MSREYLNDLIEFQTDQMRKMSFQAALAFAKDNGVCACGEDHLRHTDDNGTEYRLDADGLEWHYPPGSFFGNWKPNTGSYDDPGYSMKEFCDALTNGIDWECTCSSDFSYCPDCGTRVTFVHGCEKHGIEDADCPWCSAD